MAFLGLSSNQPTSFAKLITMAMTKPPENPSIEGLSGDTAPTGELAVLDGSATYTESSSYGMEWSEVVSRSTRART